MTIGPSEIYIDIIYYVTEIYFRLEMIEYMTRRKLSMH